MRQEKDQNQYFYPQISGKGGPLGVDVEKLGKDRGRNERSLDYLPRKRRSLGESSKTGRLVSREGPPSPSNEPNFDMRNSRPQRDRLDRAVSKDKVGG